MESSAPVHEVHDAFRENRGGLKIALTVGVLATVVDLALSYWLTRSGNVAWLGQYRGWAFFGICLLYAKLTNWNWAALGLGWKPLPVRYWLVATLVVGGIVLGATALAALGLWMATLIGWADGFPQFVSMFQGMNQFYQYLLSGCLIAPITEEPIYRFALCVPLFAAVGKNQSIVISGMLFALLHVAYGNIFPTNAVAGFVLAWAFWQSGMLWVPVALHALGNLVVALVHLELLLYAAS